MTISASGLTVRDFTRGDRVRLGPSWRARETCISGTVISVGWKYVHTRMDNGVTRSWQPYGLEKIGEPK